MLECLKLRRGLKYSEDKELSDNQRKDSNAAASASSTPPFVGKTLSTKPGASELKQAILAHMAVAKTPSFKTPSKKGLLPTVNPPDEGKALMAEEVTKPQAHHKKASSAFVTKQPAFKLAGDPLLSACKEGDCRRVLKLISQGQDVHTANADGETCLLLAVSHGHAELTALLLGFGSRLDLQDYEHGYTPLHKAALQSHSTCMKLLLECGADVNQSDKSGQTALFLAAYFGHLECTQMLLEAGANVNLQDKEGWRCLHLAAAGGHTECMSMLLAHGAQVNVSDKGGWSPLHEAAAEGHTECIRLLLEFNASLHVMDKEGNTPADVASKEVAILFQRAPASDSSSHSIRSPASLH